ncbi:SRPBCC domain-containing protein [Larkinella bovis]|uniref:SRPBCC domain-containing protein n=1 Tax=Larkinella bovis TaxID=683041 RepID=A0ABW0IKS8_9BACT
MERKTTIKAEEGKQDLVITREFDLPVELLFKAYEEPDLVEQWMGTKVLKLENKRHGSWQFATSDAHGNVVLQTNGTIHAFVPNQQIIRTFEMESTPDSAIRFPVQLEFLEFEPLADDRSKLTMQIVYRSVADRDRMLQLPFAKGINMAHNRLQDVAGKLKALDHDKTK